MVRNLYLFMHAQALTNEAEKSCARNDIDIVMCSHKNIQKLSELFNGEIYEVKARQDIRDENETGNRSRFAARNLRDGVFSSRKIGLCHQSCTWWDSSKEKRKEREKKTWGLHWNQQPCIWFHVEKKSSSASDQSVMHIIYIYIHMCVRLILPWWPRSDQHVGTPLVNKPCSS